jgi:glutathione S-transferase
MKLYDFTGAPNPRKLRVYLAEKGIQVPTEQVNLMSGDNRKPEFLKKNSMGGLPVLELDDGTHLAESLAIMEYFEELHPNPPMIGSTPLERAKVRALERICELNIMSRLGTIFQNTSPFFAGRIKQIPESAEVAKQQLDTALGVLDAKIGSNPFVAGARPTIADCTLLAAMGFADFAQVAIDPKHKNIHRWYESFKQRPSAAV